MEPCYLQGAICRGAKAAAAAAVLSTGIDLRGPGPY